MSVNALANYLASLQQGEENHRTEIVYGEVMTVDPLSIRFGELNVTKPFLVPSKMYTPTEPGQKVMAIKTNGGQIYFVLHEKDFVVPDYYGLIEELEERLTKHTHDHITVPDNRNVVSVPSDLKGSTISADFKTNASAGSPPVTASDSYAHLINVAGYSSGEGSGGWPSQISVGDGLAIRQATGASSWGTWRKVAIESDIFDDSGSYRGLKSKSGGVSGYVRTPQGGLLPYAQSNDSYLGSSLWPFRGVYADTVYEGGTALVNKYAHTSQIGNLALLTTSHKSTLVGAINEIHENNSLFHPIVIYDTSTTLVDNAIKSNWSSIPVGDSERIIVYAIIRVAASNSGIATIVKTQTGSGKVLLIKTSGSTTVTSQMNYDGSTWT